MKQPIVFGWLSALSLILVLAGCKGAPAPGEPSHFHRYGVEHGHIQFRYYGDSRGSEDVVFDRWGEREAQFSKYEHLQVEGIQPVLTLKLTRGADIFMCDIKKRDCNHWKDPQLDSLRKLSASDVPTSDQATAAYLADGFTKSGTENIAGVQADVWKLKLAPSAIYLWRSVLVKRVMHSQDDSTIVEAVTIDTTSAIDTMQFNIPPGFTVHDRLAPPGQ